MSYISDNTDGNLFFPACETNLINKRSQHNRHQSTSMSNPCEDYSDVMMDYNASDNEKQYRKHPKMISPHHAYNHGPNGNQSGIQSFSKTYLGKEILCMDPRSRSFLNNSNKNIYAEPYYPSKLSIQTEEIYPDVRGVCSHGNKLGDQQYLPTFDEQTAHFLETGPSHYYPNICTRYTPQCHTGHCLEDALYSDMSVFHPDSRVSQLNVNVATNYSEELGEKQMVTFDAGDPIEYGHPEVSSADSEVGSKMQHSEIEKRRRDKMNSYIVELSSLIPQCQVTRKLDKLTVLRLAVQHLGSLKSQSLLEFDFDEDTDEQFCGKQNTILSNDEMKSLIFQMVDGFLFVLSCDRGKFLFISETVQNYLGYSPGELIGQFIFDYIHAKDVSVIKENLIPSFKDDESCSKGGDTNLSSTFSRITEKLHVNKGMELLIHNGTKRTFFIRFKVNSSGSTTDYKNLNSLNSPNKSCDARSNAYVILRCVGYVKSLSDVNCDKRFASAAASEKKYRRKNSPSSPEEDRLSCLVVVAHAFIYDTARVQNLSRKYALNEYDRMNWCMDLEACLSRIDLQTTHFLGHMPQDVSGMSIYNFLHSDQINMFEACFNLARLGSKDVTIPRLQILSSNGFYLPFSCTINCFINPLTQESVFFSCRFNLLTEEFLTSHNLIKQELPSSHKMFGLKSPPAVSILRKDHKTSVKQSNQGLLLRSDDNESKLKAITRQVLQLIKRYRLASQNTKHSDWKEVKLSNDNVEKDNSKFVSSWLRTLTAPLGMEEENMMTIVMSLLESEAGTSCGLTPWMQ